MVQDYRAYLLEPTLSPSTLNLRLSTLSFNPTSTLFWA
jgi:hypothetical protein